MDEEYTTIERYVINAVKKKRLECGMNPTRLSLEIGLSSSVIGKIENYESGCKYNLNQLNEIAKVLNCNISDFLPDSYVKADCIEEYQIIREKRKQKRKQAIQ